MAFFDNKIDVSDVPDNVGSEPLPEGEYLMKAVEFDDTATSSKGNDMLVVDFAFVDSSLEKRRSIKTHFVVGSQVAYSILKRWIRATGIEVTTEITRDTIQAAMGRHFKGKLTQEEYNGYTNNKLNGFFPPDHVAKPVAQPAASSGDVNQQAPAQPSANLQKADWS